MKLFYHVHVIFVVCWCVVLSHMVFAHSCDQHEEIFTSIYDHAVWGKNDQGEGFSGLGSLVRNTESYMRLLTDFMKTHSIRRVVDVGCGDWEFSKLINWDGIAYIGYDIVGSVIAKNNACYAADNIHFVHANFLKFDLPEADLLLCKDVLQHLSNEDIMSFLPRLKKFKYCLITNDVDRSTLSSLNSDGAIGGRHTLDLSRPPFNCVGVKLLNFRSWVTVKQVFFIDNTNILFEN